MASLTIQGASRAFGKEVALVDVDLTVDEGEFCVVVGPSGCGKSTLLRAVAGLEPIDRGTIRIGDRDVAGVAPRDRDVAFVFQSYALYPHLSVRGNLEFPLRVRGLPTRERDKRVKDVARLLRIAELLDRRPRELSGGQRQRVAIGRAVVRRPEIFLFDEPLSNLDARLRGSMRVELVELHRELGITSLYVTHDQAEAMTLAQKLVVMHRGRIRQIGAPHEVYQRPADTFVADFVGNPSMNFFEGTIDAAGGRQIFRFGDASLEVGGSLPAGAVTLGVRPEDLIAGAGPIEARVRIVEDLGSEVLVYAEAPTGAIVYKIATADPRPKVGDAVALAIREDRAHWFVEGRRV